VESVSRSIIHCLEEDDREDETRKERGRRRKTKTKHSGINILLNDYACFFPFCWLKVNETDFFSL